MDTSTVTAADLVARGAELLDQAYVNRDVAWWDQVDLDTLDIRSPCDCVVAQTVGRFDPPKPCWCGQIDCDAVTTGSYADGLDVLGVRGDQGSEYGFCSSLDGAVGELENAWRELILARRDRDQASLAATVALVDKARAEIEEIVHGTDD